MKEPEEIDCYRVLKVSKGATLLDIKKSYRKRVLETHPDKNPGAETAPFVKVIFSFLFVILFIYLFLRLEKENLLGWPDMVKQNLTLEPIFAGPKRMGDFEQCVETILFRLQIRQN